MTPHDDKIYKEFRRLFPDLRLDILDEEDIKNDASKMVRILILFYQKRGKQYLPKAIVLALKKPKGVDVSIK